MKKFLTVFIICVILIGSVFVIYRNPKLLNNISLMISDIKGMFSSDKVEPYTSDFSINKLGIKNNSFYFNTLTEEQKIIYTAIANGVKDLSSEIDLKEYNYIDSETAMKDVEIALHKFLLDHPEVFYLEEKYSVESIETLSKTRIRLRLNYSYENMEQLNEKINEIDVIINNIISECNIIEGESFNNEVKIHDYLGESISYYKYEKISDIPNKCHNIYGALVENSAVCDGIAKALQVLLDRAGINSIVVSGSLKSEPHAWNLVEIDGEWYHTDLTSNKSIESVDENVVVHSYFNITSEEIKESHTIDEENILPQSTSNNNNYYIKNNSYIDNMSDFNTKLKSILDNNKNESLVEFKVEGISDVPDKTIRVLRDGDYTSYLDRNATKFVYYNILDTYIIFKK